MPTPPDKTKPLADWSVDDHARHQRDGTEPVSDEYLRYRADALRAAGLTDEADASEPEPERDLAALTPHQHYEQIRNGGR